MQVAQRNMHSETTPTLFYQKHVKQPLKCLFNDPVDVVGYWREARHTLQKELGVVWNEAVAKQVEKWFWEEDLPLEMVRLFQSDHAQSRFGYSTFDEVWRGLNDEERTSWTQKHWLGVWSVFCGIQPEKRPQSPSQPGGLMFQVTHRMPWNWMEKWWGFKPEGLVLPSDSTHRRLRECFETPSHQWQQIDPLSVKNDTVEIQKRCAIWGVWWRMGVAAYSDSQAKAVIQGKVGLSRRPNLLTQSWYVDWLDQERKNDCTWWVEGVLLLKENVNNLPNRCGLERGLEALRKVATKERLNALGAALGVKKAKGATLLDAELEKWVLSLRVGSVQIQNRPEAL